MHLMLSTAKPISAMSLSCLMQIQYRTCWHLLYHLRAMLADGVKFPLAGIIEADERMSAAKRATGRSTGRKRRADAAPTSPWCSPRSNVAARRGRRLRHLPARSRLIRRCIVGSTRTRSSAPMDWPLTSGSAGRCVGITVLRTRRANTRVRKARSRVHTNTVEGFFGLFKIGILGIHHAVSAQHLRRYATEHGFRYNRRCTMLVSRPRRLIGQNGRLRLRELFA
jgi:hypothetical protein